MSREHKVTAEKQWGKLRRDLRGGHSISVMKRWGGGHMTRASEVVF